MKKKALVIMTTAIFTIGAVTAVYAKESNNSNNFGFSGGMMYQNNMNSNGTYNKMMGSVNKQEMVNIHNSMMRR